MIGDALLLFSDAQAVTSDAASTSYVDLGAARNIGIGERLYIVVTVDQAMEDTGNNSTCTVTAEYDSTTSFSPDASQTLGTFAALSAAGSKIVAPISPVVLTSGYRYVQLKYTMANGDLSAGKFTAQIVKDADLYVSYPKGYTIS